MTILPSFCIMRTVLRLSARIQAPGNDGIGPLRIIRLSAEERHPLAVMIHPTRSRRVCQLHVIGSDAVESGCTGWRRVGLDLPINHRRVGEIELNVGILPHGGWSLPVTLVENPIGM